MHSLQSSIEPSSIVQSQHSLIFGFKTGEQIRARRDKMLAQSGAHRGPTKRKETQMAYVSSNRTTATLSLGNRLAEIRKDMATAWRAYSVYRQTLRELQALSMRELNDLGLNPSMLRSIAMEAAYGKKA